MSKTQYLVVLDTDRIKEYVFASSKLKEIRGASAILDELNLDETKKIAKIFGGEKIYIAGGSGKFWFSDRNNADDFCHEIEQKYYDETLTASVSTWIEEKKNDENLRDTLDRAEKKIRHKKDSKEFSTQLETNPYFKFCQLCGIYPAAELREQQQWICASCKLKNKASIKRINIYNEFENQLSFKPNWDKNYPEDFNEIGDSCVSKGYLGFIYADGNAMGKMLQSLLQSLPDDAQKLYDFSNAVDKATKHGIIKAVLNHIPELVSVESESRGKTDIFPVEFIIAGGDDLVVAVPAAKALQIALDFCKHFEAIFFDEFGEANEKYLTISCGVVIAKSTYPINLLFKLAESLLKSAKRLSKEPLLKDREAQTVSAIDFSVITTSATGNLTEIRKSEFEYKSGGTIHLTERPYRLKDLEDLIDFAKTCKGRGFPNNKLKLLYQSLFEGKYQATLNYLNMIRRLPDDLKELFQSKISEFTILPWREKPNRFREYTTPFLDFVEIYEYVTSDIETEETNK